VFVEKIKIPKDHGGRFRGRWEVGVESIFLLLVSAKQATRGVSNRPPTREFSNTVERER
jgi:hypothetical protein